MNGQYKVIKVIDKKIKFYWAPLSPWPKKDYEDWGVAVIDLNWQTTDPRPKHLRATPLAYDRQSFVQVLRDPLIDGSIEKIYRYTVLYKEQIRGFITQALKGEKYFAWASG